MTLYYDAGCNLCHASQLRAGRWARRAGVEIDIRPLQSPEAAAKGYGDAMVLETSEGTFQAEEAWFELLKLAPWYLRWLRAFLWTPPTRALMAWGYRLVARYRIRVFGSRACALPPR